MKYRKPGMFPLHRRRFPRHHRRERHLFFRFFGVFGFITLLLFVGFFVSVFIIGRFFGDGRPPKFMLVGGCALALIFPLVAMIFARGAFRQIASPLAEIMAAADSVAEGDLSVRVPERGPGEFARLGRSFNRMTVELERADRQRRNLTADVAHELRTPLHVLQGNLEGILDGVYQPTSEHVDAMLEETRLLSRLVDDLQTLSLAESGQLPLSRAPVDVVELLNDVATSFGGQAEAAGVDLSLDLAPGLDAVALIGDAGRLDQVLGNLVANALRHTPTGGTITLRGESQGRLLHLLVSDTGEGIPPEDLEYIFDRFWRGDPARSHAGGAGSGLGLAIARQLVRSHGGSIRVESELDHGTTFTIELPLDGGDEDGVG